MTNRDRISRVRVSIQGAVQGVGFRPFIYRLAADLRLNGWIKNSSQGVLIEAEGTDRLLECFLLRVEAEKPPRSFIQSLESSFLDPAGYKRFEILPSNGEGKKTALIMSDIATCPDCLKEIADPANRRYRYPFTNCTNCGPRFSIIESLPYDRPNTTMKWFTMCASCRSEYENPLDRRFHAQPNACPECGPLLELWDHSGVKLASGDQALRETAKRIRHGAIVAVKGLGGFHLMADARNNDAILTLRQRKHREEKPLALMFPTLDSIKTACTVSPLEERLLVSPEAPIVLLRRISAEDFISSAIAPRNPYLGVLLPYTPLHYLLMMEVGFPVVATSGNLADETLCTDEMEAITRLGGVADVFLVHTRPIARHMDDSIARIVSGREMILRRARGYAPLPIHMQKPLPPLIAVGGHLKNTIAISAGDRVFLSQHIGNLETTQTLNAFNQTIEGFSRLYGLPENTNRLTMCDAHPDYASTRFADKLGEGTRVQHHYAHILSCMAENDLIGCPSVLGVAWDGMGYGDDATLWGGEFLRIGDNGFRRVAHLRTFRLPGGEKAAKEPRRVALGLLYEVFGDKVFAMKGLATVCAFSPNELEVLRTAIRRNINTPITSSAGRLFDAIASIIGLRQLSGFEGQAAMELEFSSMGFPTELSYDFELVDKNRLVVIDWEPLLRDILADLQSSVTASAISAKFHNTLTAIVIAVAKRIGEERVVLSGGCFQNKYLTERTVQALESKHLRPYWHQRVPPNDGGLALGQAVAAGFLQMESSCALPFPEKS